jgi:hypothetical protein
MLLNDLDDLIAAAFLPRVLQIGGYKALGSGKVLSLNGL